MPKGVSWHVKFHYTFIYYSNLIIVWLGFLTNIGSYYILFIGKSKRIQEAKIEAASEIEIEKKERERQYKIREDEVKAEMRFNLENLLQNFPSIGILSSTQLILL